MSIKSAIASFVQTLGAASFELGQQLLPSSMRNPHRVYRDHRHLDDVYRRVLTSSLAAADIMHRQLMTDPYFEKLFMGKEGRYLVRVAVISDELVANVYRLARYREKNMFEVYNPDWGRDGVAHLYVNREIDDEGLMNTTSSVVIREVEGDYRYDYFEPIQSYARLLTKAELVELEPVARVNRRAMERYYARLEQIKDQAKQDFKARGAN